MDLLELSEEIIDFNALSQDEITRELNQYNIGLSESEILHIQNHILQRAPTLTECLLWSIEGSEHCSYKSSKQFLKTLPTTAPHIILGVGEDAAVVSVAKSSNGYRYGIAISHESHNHPSQIVPFEGAATGVGGNVRDIACMGATVIAVADSLRFGELNNNKTRWLNKEVVAGIASYGNALGIPNIAGDVAYHPSYQQNCLVTVVSLGVVREDKIIHSYVPDNSDGYDLILIGKATDNSGFGGASFASTQLDEGQANRGAVQEPNAFLERHLLKANQALIEKLDSDNLLSQVAFKDLGAGGIGCASVELADGNGFGAEVNLDLVHVGMGNLHPSVILCSETQERFMWAVPSSLTKLILNHYNDTFDLPNVSHGAKASLIGKVTKEPQYVVLAKGKIQVDAKAKDVTEGLTAPRQYQKPLDVKFINNLPESESITKSFLTLISSPNIACQKPIYEHYDKQVQGRTIIERGQAKAGVISPFNDDSFPEDIQLTGVALSCSQNPRQTLIDSYWGTQKAITTALERLASVGASPIAITDCLCFGDPSNKEHMWQFVKAVEAINDVCNSYQIFNEANINLPVVGGNVSFYNESQGNAIAPSPMISCLARMENYNNSKTFAFKNTNSKIYLLREQSTSLTGSIYSDFFKTDNEITKLDLQQIQKQIHFMLECFDTKLIKAASNIDEGGLAINVAKMSLASNIGFSINLENSINIYQELFCESGGFIFEANVTKSNELEKIAADYGVNLQCIGQTDTSNKIQINNELNLTIEEVKAQWRSVINLN